MSGSECPDLAAAHLHAEAVASELMRNCHHGTKLWSLRVEDEEARHVFDLFFAELNVMSTTGVQSADTPLRGWLW